MKFPALDIGAVLPLLIAATGALAVLVADLLLRAHAARPAPRLTPELAGRGLALLSALFLAAAALFSAAAMPHAARNFNADHPLVQLDALSAFCMAVLSLAAILACLLSVNYLRTLRIAHGEYYALLLVAVAGMFLLVCAVDMMAIFLGIEMLSIPIYVLAGFDRRKLRSNESALKYFIVGSFASALMLYGIALLYGATGATQLDAIREAFDAENPLAMIGAGLVVVGFTFKISSVPFHQWTPDVYEGAPTSVTAFMSVTVKLAAFAALLRVLGVAFVAAAEPLREILWLLAFLTMAVGNFMALVQDNVKRLLAYSSVAHAGYLLIGFAAASADSYAAVLFYLMAYAPMNLGAFGVLMCLTRQGRDADRIEDLAGLAQRSPGLAAALTLFAGSLAGMPATVGFQAKFHLFVAAVRAEHVSIVVVAVLTSLVSFYYYLRLVVFMYMREPGENAPRPRVGSFEALAIGFCAAAVVILGLLPNGDFAGLIGWLRTLDWARAAALPALP